MSCGVTESILLQAREISRCSGATLLLDRISLAIHGGDRIALSGATGSGKTLMLRALAMLDPIDQGTLLWKGKSIRCSEVPSYRSQVIYVHQQPAMFPGSVLDNILAATRFKTHQGLRWNDESLQIALDDLQLSKSFLDKSQENLSGGERQITALLRACLLNPQILLLDESTSALDAKTTVRVEAYLQEWVNSSKRDHDDREGRAILWVTHDQSQRDRIGNRQFTMDAGRLREMVSA